MDEPDEENGDSAEDKEDSGWKNVHGEVFRPPKNLMLFTAALGNGAQILALTVLILILAVIGTFYPGRRGSVYTALFVLYAVTAFISGYISTKMYVQLGGEHWATNSGLISIASVVA
jgi:transmembrane 9 superfamily protein 3